MSGGKASGGVPKIMNPRASVRLRRHFERDMTAEAPPDENGAAELKCVHDRPDGAGVAGQRIGARVSRVVRGPVARQIDRDKPKPLPQRPVKLMGKDPRRRRIAVDKHRRRPFAPGLAKRDRAVRRVDPQCFHGLSFSAAKAAALTAPHDPASASLPNVGRTARFHA